MNELGTIERGHPLATEVIFHGPDGSVVDFPFAEPDIHDLSPASFTGTPETIETPTPVVVDSEPQESIARNLSNKLSDKSTPTKSKIIDGLQKAADSVEAATINTGRRVGEVFANAREAISLRRRSISRSIGALATVGVLGIGLAGSASTENSASAEESPVSTAPNEEAKPVITESSTSASTVNEAIADALANKPEPQPEVESTDSPESEIYNGFDEDDINSAFRENRRIRADSIAKAIEAQEAAELAKEEATRIAKEKLNLDYSSVGEILKELYQSGSPGDRIGYIKINGEQLTAKDPVTGGDGEPVYLHQSVGFFQDDLEGKFIDYVEEGPGMPEDYKIGEDKNAAVLGHFSSGENRAPMRNLKDVVEGDILEVVIQKKMPDGTYVDVAVLTYTANEDAFSVKPFEVDHFVNQEVDVPRLTVGTCGNVAGNSGSTTLFRSIVPFDLQSVALREDSVVAAEDASQPIAD